LESLKIKYQSLNVVTSDFLPLKVWYVPNKKKTPILLLHGHGSNRLAFMKQVAYLHRSGYPIVLFDFRGCGTAPGKYISMGVHETKDIQAVMDHLQKKYHYSSFGILSNSMGANAALLTAAKDQRIKAIVCDSPFSSMAEVIKLRGKRDYPFLPEWFYRLGFKIIEWRIQIKMSDADGTLALQKINIPILYIQGTRDDLKGTFFAKKLLKNSPAGSQLWEVPEAEHFKNFEKNPVLYKKKVLDYFKKRLVNP
jgi:pimeloyl-ACP methyl ester carboxylesterase